jgi:hypothetical protein
VDRSDSLGELAAALSAAQREIQGAKKDHENAAFRNNGKVSKYADLGAVWDACREALGKNALAVAQTFEPAPEGYLLLRTTLLHKSGEWMSGASMVPLPKSDPQGYGSAATYARRYGLMAMVGVAPEDDDDGNAASHAQGQQPRQNPRPESRGDQRAQEPASASNGKARTEAAVKNAERPLPTGTVQQARDEFFAAWTAAGGEKGKAFVSFLAAQLGREVKGWDDVTEAELRSLTGKLRSGEIGPDPFDVPDPGGVPAGANAMANGL